MKKSEEPILEGKKCEKCGNIKYIVKDNGFTAICTACHTRYDN